MSDITQQELAVRVAILEVAPTGTILVKSDSPGRLYESKTIEELSDMLSGGSEVHGTFSWGDATPAVIATMAAGSVIYSISVIILEPFDGEGAELSLGITGNADLFMKVTECDPRMVGVFTVSPGYLFAAEDVVKLFITPGEKAAEGCGVIIINY